ncbi:MAG: hypothetical protein MZU95_17665 [Desulfomicrobium escambiense]|nr:hypothetical protein [Desulfomicrobium escambiense]
METGSRCAILVTAARQGADRSSAAGRLSPLSPAAIVRSGNAEKDSRV